MVQHEKLNTGIIKHPKGMTVRKPCIAYKELRDVIARLLPDDCSRIDADLFLIRAIGKNEEFSEALHNTLSRLDLLRHLITSIKKSPGP